MSLTPPPVGPVLALDTGSPVLSAAVVSKDGVLAERISHDAHSSASLLDLVDRSLDAAGVALGDLGGACALSGPGSFTGLRVGLASVLGLHQALALPATAIPTLSVLASLAEGDHVLACVDALRGAWFRQSYRVRAGAAVALSSPRFESVGEAELEGVEIVVGFGAHALLGDRRGGGLRVMEPQALAAAAGLATPHVAWDAELLTNPLYLRPPPVRSPPAGPRRLS
jgi:tRNA threonylcarbamoyladenosine biosynthesis protein TsaB